MRHYLHVFFFFSSRRRHTRLTCDWSSDVCSSDLYYAGVNLVILAVALLMPWHPAWSAVTCAILIGGYVVCSLLAGPIADSRIFVNNLFFLGTTGVIAVVGTAVRDALRRREFANRHALTEALHHRDVFMAKMS